MDETKEWIFLLFLTVVPKHSLLANVLGFYFLTCLLVCARPERLIREANYVFFGVCLFSYQSYFWFCVQFPYKVFNVLPKTCISVFRRITFSSLKSYESRTKAAHAHDSFAPYGATEVQRRSDGSREYTRPCFQVKSMYSNY